MEKSDRFKIYPTCKKCSQFFETDLLFEFHKLGPEWPRKWKVKSPKTHHTQVLAYAFFMAHWHSKKRMLRNKTDVPKMWPDISWCHISKYSLRKALSKSGGRFSKIKKYISYFDEIDLKIILSSIVSSTYKLNPTLFPKNLNAAARRRVYN